MPFFTSTSRRSWRLMAATATAVAATALTVTPADATPTPTPPPKATTPVVPSSARQVAPPSHQASLAGMIKLPPECSASLVRYPTSRDKDQALMLTNGHCWEGVFILPGVVLTDQPSSRTGDLLDARGRTVGQVQTDRLLYATMTGTDIALYRLTQTYAEIKRATGIKALTLASTHPVDGRAVTIASGYWQTTYSCRIDGFAPAVNEAFWTWQDSIRYDPTSGCQLVAGTSGSPIVDDNNGKIVGINNTANTDGGSCTLNNPCEINPGGTTTVVKGEGYGQQTYWITTCLTHNTLDLAKAGCLLPKP
ncbi:S1 family peptidase [Jatrophihabitans sp.]|uniref:S1 family peptidase n=1 Tax=Jatrophihabitans sp. TaxID=1932789 RepID=UPI002CDE8FF0|nr:serine protease [Jatrophihabitans sp.]